MAHTSLYRKYRPQTFDDVVGQSAHHAHAAQRGRRRHRRARVPVHRSARHRQDHDRAHPRQGARLREGPDAASPTARASSCVEIAEGRHPDVYELDAASRTGVDNVREEIIGRVQLRADARPLQGLHHRRGPHAVDRGVQRAAQDARGAAVARASSCCARRTRTRCPRPSSPAASASTSAASASTTSSSACASSRDAERHRGARRRAHAHRAPRRRRDARRDHHARAARRVHRRQHRARRRRGAARRGRLGAALRGRRTSSRAATSPGCFRWVAAFAESGTDLAEFVRELTGARPRPVRRSPRCGDAHRRRRRDRRGPSRRFEAQAARVRRTGPARARCSTCSASSRPRCAGRATRGSRSRSRSRAWRGPQGELTLEALAERLEALEGGGAAGLRAPASRPRTLGGLHARPASTADAASAGDPGRCARSRHGPGYRAEHDFAEPAATEAAVRAGAGGASGRRGTCTARVPAARPCGRVARVWPARARRDPRRRSRPGRTCSRPSTSTSTATGTTLVLEFPDGPGVPDATSRPPTRTARCFAARSRRRHAGLAPPFRYQLGRGAVRPPGRRRRSRKHRSFTATPRQLTATPEPPTAVSGRGAADRRCGHHHGASPTMTRPSTTSTELLAEQFGARDRRRGDTEA